MASTTAEILDALHQYHIMEPRQLEELARQLPPHEVDPRVVAQKLVAHGTLTPYQANRLLQGKGSELLLGSYVVLERLGEGGMGAVFKARNWKLGQIVALKLMHKSSMTNPDAVRRFQREIHAVAQLNHPNIVRAFDADAVDGTQILVMEHVAGTDLAHLVREKGPLPIDQAISCILQAAQGLSHAHAIGIVHRDIKPGNLLLDNKGTVKVLDMGLARIDGAENAPQVGTATEGLTKSGSIMGTSDYMAPEQALNTKKADQRADVYSLGCTLWFLLTGRPLYHGETVMEKLLAHREEPIPSLIDHRPEVPVELDSVFRRMVAKKPIDRYSSMAEVIAALQGRVAEQSSAELGQAAQELRHRQGLSVGLDETMANQRTPGHTAVPVLHRHGRGLIVACGLLFLAVLGGFAILLNRTETQPLATQRLEQGGTNTGKATDPGKGSDGPPSPAVAPFVKKQAQHYQRIWAEHLKQPVIGKNSVGMDLALVPPGEFMMGSPESEPGRQPSEGPQHRVLLTHPFYMGTCEVSKEQFAAVMGQPALEEERRRLPASHMRWKGAVDFCRALSSRPEEMRQGRIYRLPTEAEWEYACRAGTQTAYSFGDDMRLLDEHVWHHGIGKGKSRPVGTLKPNAWGLHDMNGNISEWCADYHRPAYDAAARQVDPQGPPAGKDRVVRGGSCWGGDGPSNCRSASRFAVDPAWESVGFRVVCEIAAPPAVGMLSEFPVDEEVMRLAFIDGGKGLLLAGRAGNLWTRDLTTGQETTKTAALSREPSALALFPDGRVVIGGFDGALSVWKSAADLTRLKEWPAAGSGGRTAAVSVSSDGRLLATAHFSGVVRVFRTGTWWNSATIQVARRGIAVRLSPDGKHLLLPREDNLLVLRPLAGGDDIAPLEKTAEGPACFSADGRLIACCGEGDTLLVWDWRAGRVLHKLQGHAEGLVGLDFTPDGRFLLSAGYRDNRLCVHDAITGAMVNEFKQLFLFRGLAIAPDGRTAALSTSLNRVVLFRLPPPPRPASTCCR